MARLLIHVEGLTEETFVANVLEPHLCQRGYERVSARIVGNARLRARRGGIRTWDVVRRDIVNHLKEDAGCWATTMVDYYGLPQNGPGSWPGRSEAGRVTFAQKAALVEDGVAEDICSELGESRDRCRFVPYVMMHEFEGLLFSDCDAFGRGIGRPELTPEFQAIRDQFDTPEEINDSAVSAPSKRVEGLIPRYQKAHLGTLAVLEIGLNKISAECPHFRRWLEKLEAWPGRRRRAEKT